MADHPDLHRAFGPPLATCMLAPQDGSPILMIFYVRPLAAPSVRLLVGETIGRVDGPGLANVRVSAVGQTMINRLSLLKPPDQSLIVVEIKRQNRARRRVKAALEEAGAMGAAVLFVAATPALVDGVSWLLGVMQMPRFPKEDDSAERVAH
jgi:hypothetical protein